MHLEKLVEQVKGFLQLQEEFVSILVVSNRLEITTGEVKVALKELSKQGLIESIPKSGRTPDRYALTVSSTAADKPEPPVYDPNRRKMPMHYEQHETPKPEGETPVGKTESKQSAYMVVVNGETSLHISKEKADELAAQQAKIEATVFIYEIVSVKQIVYKPTAVAHDLASLCS